MQSSNTKPGQHNRRAPPIDPKCERWFVDGVVKGQVAWRDVPTSERLFGLHNQASVHRTGSSFFQDSLGA